MLPCFGAVHDASVTWRVMEWYKADSRGRGKSVPGGEGGSIPSAKHKQRRLNSELPVLDWRRERASNPQRAPPRGKAGSGSGSKPPRGSGGTTGKYAVQDQQQRNKGA